MSTGIRPPHEIWQDQQNKRNPVTSKDQHSPQLAEAARSIPIRAFWKAIRSLSPVERVKAAPQLKNVFGQLQSMGTPGSVPQPSTFPTPYEQGMGSFGGRGNTKRSVLGRLADAANWVVNGNPMAFFPPGIPLEQQAPDDTQWRKWDYPFYYNLAIQPRNYEAISFEILRLVPDSYDLLRLVLETAKAQIAGQDWDIIPSDDNLRNVPRGTQDRIKQLKAFFKFPEGPDSVVTFNQWLRSLLEDMFVLDAPALYIERQMDGLPYALKPTDGGELCLKLDYYGETPRPPLTAYQQVIKGLPGIDYDTTQILYFPFCKRTHKAYGLPVVEQMMTTINIGIRREQWQLEYYRSSTHSPYVVLTPQDWTPDQIRGAQSWWDARFGVDNLAEKWRTVFLPNGCKPLLQADQKDLNLKSELDDHILTLLCYAFSVDRSNLVKAMNRASAQQGQESSKREGFGPYSDHIRDTMTLICQHRNFFGFEDCEFSFQEDDDPNTLQAEQVAQIRLQTGTISINERRDQIGLPPIPGGDQSPLPQNTQLVQLDENNKLSDINQQKQQQADIQNQSQQESLKQQKQQTKNGQQGGAGNGGSNSGNSGKPAPGNTGSGGGSKGAGGNSKNGGTKPVSKAFDISPGPFVGPQSSDASARRAKRAARRAQRAALAKRRATYTHKDNPKLVGKLKDILHAKFQRQARRLAATINAERVRRDTVRKAAGRIEDVPFTDSILIAITKALEDDVQDFMRDGWESSFDDVQPILQEQADDATDQLINSLGNEANLSDDALAGIDDAAGDLATERAASMLGMVVDPDSGRLIPNPDPEWAVSDDVRDTVQDLVARAEAEEWSDGDLADAIAASTNFSAERAETVARTELANVANAAAAQAAKGAGAKKKSWHVSADHDEQDECDENEDEGLIDIDEDFPSGDDAPPAHPNCGCVLIFEFEDSSEGEGEGGDSSSEEDDSEE